MNEKLIENWNGRVSKDDDIYHLGDFGFARHEKLDEILQRLNGRKYFIKGNHDKPMKCLGKHFVWMKDYADISDDGRHVVLCHYGLRVWNRSFHGKTVMLYGHSKGSLPPIKNSLDVGVDCWNYRPVTLDEIKERLKAYD